MQGGKTVYVDPKSIISPAPFVRGYKELKRNIPMDYEAYMDNHVDRERYERGRLFALVFNGTLKIGKKVTWEAKDALYDAFYCGSVI